MDDRPLPCFFCGYDLRGGSEAKCPECGRALMDTLVAFEALARRRFQWAIGLAGLCTALLLAFLVFVLAALIG